MSQRYPKSIPITSLKYPKVSQNYYQSILKIIPIVSQKYPKVLQKYPKSIPKVSQGYPNSIPKVCCTIFNFYTICTICIICIPKVSQKYPKGIPIVSQKYVVLFLISTQSVLSVSSVSFCPHFQKRNVKYF